MMGQRHIFLFLLISAMFFFTTPSAWAATQTEINAEMNGIDLAGSSQSLSGSAVIRTLSYIPDGGLLLIPESTNDRVMAFDPTTGDLIDADFIPASSTQLNTPICAIPSPDARSVYISDQLNDVVQEFDFLGNYIGIFAPPGGANNSILDNMRGICLDSGGNLLVTVAGGSNDDSIAIFDGAGAYQGNLFTSGLGGLDSPYDILLRTNDYLVSAITSDAIHRYNLSGSYLGDLTAIDSFPEQLSLASNGNVLVANYSGTQEGILEYSSTGTLVGLYTPPTGGGYRGVYELGNGNLLVTNGSGVYEVDRSNSLIETKISGVSARFIEFFPAAVDLSISVTGPSTTKAGVAFQVQLNVENNGNSVASNVQATFPIPPHVTLESNTCGATVSSTNLTWNIGTLGPDIPRQCTLTLVVAEAGIGDLTFSASVDSDQTDLSSSDNTNSTIITAKSSMTVPAMTDIGIFAMAGLLLVTLLGLRSRRSRES